MENTQQNEPQLVMHCSASTSSKEKKCEDVTAKDVVVEVPLESPLGSPLSRAHTVFDILTNLGLHDYVTVFEQKGYDDLQDLCSMTGEDWKTLVRDTELKPRHAVRLKRQLEKMPNDMEGEQIIETADEERIRDWNETQVWQWLSSRPYSEKLSMSAWKFTDGLTLLALTVESAEELEVPPTLIPRILKDIKAKANQSDILVATENAGKLAGHLEQIKDLEDRLSAMDYRERVKLYGKEFGSSLIRVTIVMAITYAVLSVYMLLIDVDRPFTGAIIPTIGFQLSTLSLPSIRSCYVEHRMDQKIRKSVA